MNLARQCYQGLVVLIHQSHPGSWDPQVVRAWD